MQKISMTRVGVGLVELVASAVARAHTKSFSCFASGQSANKMRLRDTERTQEDGSWLARRLGGYRAPQPDRTRLLSVAVDRILVLVKLQGSPGYSIQGWHVEDVSVTHPHT